MRPKPISAKPLSNGPFSIGRDGFNVNGIPRTEGSSLYEMLFPNRISGKRAQKRARDRAEIIVTFPWLVAQLTFYDIEFDPQDTVAELTQLLAANVEHGRVRAIALELEQLFKAGNPEYFKVQPRIDKPRRRIGPQRRMIPTFEERHKQTLEKFEIPVDLANYDRSLFLTKYFLNRDGKPEPSKTPLPILLPGLPDRLAMQQAADTIPGLKTSSGGAGEFRIRVIGWNRAAIFDETERISVDQGRLRDELSPTWLKRLQDHYNLIKMLPVLSKPKHFAIETAQGDYAVECGGVMDNYGGSDHDDSNLRILHSKADRWFGVFKIGVIYGVMRLDTDRRALLARCKATEKNESREDDHTEMDIPLEELGTTEEDDDASEEEDLFSDLSADEEKEEVEHSSPGFQVVTRRKQRRAHTEASNTSAKRSKLSSGTTPNRLYFKWRGREQGEGDIAHDGYKKNTGYLQFTDATCTKFESTISNSLIGKNVRFQGFKTSNDGGAVTRTYHEYSARAGNIFEDYY